MHSGLFWWLWIVIVSFCVSLHDYHTCALADDMGIYKGRINKQNQHCRQTAQGSTPQSRLASTLWRVSGSLPLGGCCIVIMCCWCRIRPLCLSPISQSPIISSGASVTRFLTKLNFPFFLFSWSVPFWLVVLMLIFNPRLERETIPSNQGFANFSWCPFGSGHFLTHRLILLIAWCPGLKPLARRWLTY